jgi:FkbM family methyltransferase
MNPKSLVLSIIPEKLKAPIRPHYKKISKIFAGREIANENSGDSDVSNKNQIKESYVIAIRKYSGFEVAFRKKTSDVNVIAHSFDNDIFFTGVPEYQPEEGGVVIDMGAHIGTFSLLASSKVCNTGKVYAIEASADTFNFLKINVALNKRDNISVHRLAMADKDGTCVLFHDLEAGNWGHSTVKKLSAVTEPVQSCTLKKFMEKNVISECDFMKLNIEGAEFPVILSAPYEVLQRFGVILVLYHCDMWAKNTEKDLISHLESSGFDCVIRNKTQERGWIIAKNRHMHS